MGMGIVKLLKKLFYLNFIRPFAKLRKLTNWQLADCNRQINCNHPGPETDFFHGVSRHHSFPFTAQNNCTNKQLRLIKHLFIFLILVCHTYS